MVASISEVTDRRMGWLDAEEIVGGGRQLS
jgi:hypothetical protein